ncbi:MAG: hydrolase [Lachnospiraceae bacterium]|nr:hydrolase [Candidatus Equihabitans merdae]
MIFYTADMHFGYEPILELAQRPFTSIEEMREVLIANWNERVSDDDHVYILGDVGLAKGPVDLESVSRLKGHKHLIRGNHDTGLDNQEDWYQYLESVDDFLEIDDGDTHILMSHYPMIYNLRGYMIHGHMHNTLGSAYDMLKQLPRVLNCGVDVNNYVPVTLEELIANNERFYADPSLGVERRPGKRIPGRNVKPDFRPLPKKP